MILLSGVPLRLQLGGLLVSDCVAKGNQDSGTVDFSKQLSFGDNFWIWGFDSVLLGLSDGSDL